MASGFVASAGVIRNSVAVDLPSESATPDLSNPAVRRTETSAGALPVANGLRPEPVMCP